MESIIRDTANYNSGKYIYITNEHGFTVVLLNCLLAAIYYIYICMYAVYSYIQLCQLLVITQVYTHTIVCDAAELAAAA